jgi:hypothetical protein
MTTQTEVLLRGKEDPLFETVNGLFKRSRKFSNAVAERTREKYPKSLTMAQMIHTAIELYEEAGATTVLQTYET